MSVQERLFHDWPDDSVTDSRLRFLEQALESFAPREAIHVAAALLADAHRASGVKQASYALNGFVVTVEDVRGA